MVLILEEKASKKIIAKFFPERTEIIDTENYEMKNGDLEEKASGKVILKELDDEEVLLMDCKKYELITEK